MIYHGIIHYEKMTYGKEKEVIISNKIKCKKCWDVIESTYRHDLKFCKCCAVAVEGGNVINFQTDATSRYIK